MITTCFTGLDSVAQQPVGCKCGPNCQNLYNTPYNQSYSDGLCAAWGGCA